jgi:hypothetical protein
MTAFNLVLLSLLESANGLIGVFFFFFQLTKPYGLRVQGIELVLVLLISSRPP